MLSTEIGGIKLDCCIYNASGPRTGSIEALVKIGESRAGVILSKSATMTQQDGNILPRFVNKIKLGDFCEGSLNSEGLPNLGIDYYISQNAKEALGNIGKPYIVSISGTCLEDNMNMIKLILNQDFVSSIELNLACPNIPGKPIISYDFDQMDEILSKITNISGINRKALGIKLAPYFDMPHFERVAQIIAKYPIQYIVTTNTIGNCLMVDYEAECSSIAPKGGLGGLGGGFIKPIALSNVRIFYLELQKYGRPDIDIIGVGGVSTGVDAFELILCGAKAVQVGTCHWTEGPSCFDRISKELENIMITKGYKNIQNFRGKLKPYTKGSKKPTKVKQDQKLPEDILKEAQVKWMNREAMYQGIIAALLAALVYAYYRFRISFY